MRRSIQVPSAHGGDTKATGAGHKPGHRGEHGPRERLLRHNDLRGAAFTAGSCRFAGVAAHEEKRSKKAADGSYYPAPVRVNVCWAAGP